MTSHYNDFTAIIEGNPRLSYLERCSAQSVLPSFTIIPFKRSQNSIQHCLVGTVWLVTANTPSCRSTPVNVARQTTLLQCCATALHRSKSVRNCIKTNRSLQCWNFYSALRVLTNVKRSQNGETPITCFTVATSILLVRMSHRAGPAVGGSSEVSLTNPGPVCRMLDCLFIPRA